jgi:Zn-finger nucleic acid-binding protein
MSVHKYKKSKETNVDECFKCGAFFLDSGELKLIRDTYMTEEESEQYLHKLLSDAPLYNEKMDELEKKEIRAKAIRNLTKHIRLSYYLTGK